MRDDMELKRALDALPREIEPPAEAWAGIRAQIHRPPARSPSQREFLEWLEGFRVEPRTIRIAAGIGAIGVGLTFLAFTTRASSQWRVIGSPAYVHYFRSEIRSAAELRVGATIVTPRRPVGTRYPGPHATAAVLVAGTYGRVFVGPGSQVTLLAAGPAGHRLAVERGSIAVTMSAPPRLFVVQTPVGVVTDMGCAYELNVGPGWTRLTVTQGWVTYENHGREALVPQGFDVLMDNEMHHGTPVQFGAKSTFRQAVRVWDNTNRGDAYQFNVILRDARPLDAVTLWHMLPFVSSDEREAIYDKLVAIAPPPDGVTRDGVVRDLNPIMLRLWWEQLPGTLKIDTSLMTKLWTLWLKAASWL